LQPGVTKRIYGSTRYLINAIAQISIPRIHTSTPKAQIEEIDETVDKHPVPESRGLKQTTDILSFYQPRGIVAAGPRFVVGTPPSVSRG
jgi:hypothetical protein